MAYRSAQDVLRLDSFELDAKSNVLVVGPSGCGKTTLLHLIAGLLLPTSGRVTVDGQDLAQLSPRARDRFGGQRIGIVLQQFHLLPTLTALQNLLVAQSIADLPVDRAAALTMLRSRQLLAVTAELLGTELSAGATRVIVSDLETYPIPQVMSALRRVVCWYRLK